MTWPSWEEALTKMKQFEQKLSDAEIKGIEYVKKFQDRHPILDGIVKGATPLLPPPINNIVQGIYENASDPIKGATEVLEYLNKIKEQGKEHYEEITKTLDSIKYDMAKEETQLQIKEILISTGDILKQKFEVLKQMSGEITEMHSMVTKIYLEIIEKKTEYSKQDVYDEFRPNPLLESKTYNELPFEEQIIIFNNLVCKEYDEYPEHRPLILNFTKLKNGGNQFVKQRYKDRKTHEIGDNIFTYVKNTVQKKFEEFEKLHNERNKKDELEKEISQFSFGKKILDILENENILSDKRLVQLKIWKSVGLSKEIITWMVEEDSLSLSMSNETKAKNLIEKAKNQISKIKDYEITIKKHTEQKEALEDDINPKENEGEHSIRHKKIEELEAKINDLESDKNQIENFYNVYRDQIEKNEQKLSTIKSYKKIQLDAQSKIKNLDSDTKKQIQIVKELSNDAKKYLKLKTKSNYQEKIIKRLELEKLIPIIGEYGSGKSALCNHLLNYFCSDEYSGPIAIFVPLGELSKNQDSNLEEELFNFTKKEYHFNLEKLDFFEKIESGEFLFILDALDEMSYTLDNKIGQNNLEKIIKLAEKTIVLVTSRHTYLSNRMIKNLFEYDNLIEVLDFELEEIKLFLNYKLQNTTEVNKILEMIEKDSKISELAKKPLFLNVIHENFDTIENYRIINESIMLSILTNKWLEHDSKIKKQETDAERKALIDIRKKISEILAFAKTGINETISIDDIQQTVKEDLGSYYPNVLENLKEYYHDAITSTFLVKEENETYRFLSNHIREFFIARGIVNDINKNDPDALKKHLDIISSEEIFIFIKGLIENEWTIADHVQTELNKIRTNILEGTTINDEKASKILSEESKYFQKFENKSFVLLKILKNIQKTRSDENVGNIIRILNMTNNLPPKTDLSNLNLSDSILENANFAGMKLTNSNLSLCNLRGSNFFNANLKSTNFTESDLSGSNFAKCILYETKFNLADVNNANFEGDELDFTDFTMANLTKSNLINVKINHTKFRGTIFIAAKLGEINFREMDLQETIFIRTELNDVHFIHADLTGVDFTGCDLKTQDFTDAVLNNAKLFGADLTNTVFNRAKLHRAKFAGSIMTGTDLSSAELNYVDDLPISMEEALNRGARF